MAEDYGVSIKINADTSDLDKVKEKAEEVQKKISKPVEAPAPVKVQVEPPETVKVKVEQPEPVAVKVSQEPDPLKIKIELPDPAEIQATASKPDFHVDVQPRLDPSKLQSIPPIKVPVENPEIKPKVDPSQALNGFNAMRAASAALQGNVAALGVEIAKLGTSAGTLKTLGVAGFSAIGAAIAGVVMLAGSLRDLFATVFNVGQVDKDIRGMGAALIYIRNEAENFASAMDDARKASELVNQSLEEEVAALGRVAKAQNEINRQRELSAAKSDDERAAINTRYDRKSIDIEANTAQQTEELKRKGIVDEIARLEQEIAESKKTQAAYEAKASEARSRANAELPTNALTAAAEDAVSFFTLQATSVQKSKAASAVATDAQNAADDEAERRAELEEKLEKARHDLKIADLEAEARKAEESAEREKNQADEKTRKSQKDEKEAKDNAEKDKKDRLANADTKEAMAKAERRDAQDRDMARLDRMERDAKTPHEREAAQNQKILNLEKLEDEARERMQKAEEELAEEMKKDASRRSEERMARARANMREAQSDMFGARSRREDLEDDIRVKRQSKIDTYFDDLANQIEATRPKNRLTAMGLGSGGVAVDRTAQEQASNVRLLVQLAKEQLAATKANKPKQGYATFAP